MLACAAVIVGLELLYRHTLVGRAFLAIAEDNFAARALGLPERGLRMASYALAGVIEAKGAGIAVPAGDVDALEAALFSVLDDAVVRDACREASRELATQFRWTTDPTFYPTARLAMEAPRERYAYVAGLAPDNKSRSDALLVVDVDSASQSYGQIVGRLDLPNVGDELHRPIACRHAGSRLMSLPQPTWSVGGLPWQRPSRDVASSSF